jgi:cell division protein FtsB
LLVFSVVCVAVGILKFEGLPRFRMLSTQLRETRDRNAHLRDEILRLQHEADQLRHNPLAIERIAREQLGMSRKDELIFQFPKD